MSRRDAVFLGGLHDGLEFNVDIEAKVIVMPASPTDQVPSIFEDVAYSAYHETPVGNDLITYAMTGQLSKDKRWIFQMI